MSGKGNNSDSGIGLVVLGSIVFALLLLYFSTGQFTEDFVSVAWLIPVFPIVTFGLIILFGIAKSPFVTILLKYLNGCGWLKTLDKSENLKMSKNYDFNQGLKLVKKFKKGINQES